MIDDVRDLSVIEKKKILARKRFFSCFGQCVAGIVVATFAIVLFGLFLTSDFLAAFKPAAALRTTGFFVASFAINLLLFSGVYRFAGKDGKPVRDYWLAIMVAVITYMLSIVSSCKLNVFAMPLTLATLVVIELTGRRSATLTTALVAVLVVLTYVFSGNNYDISLIVSAAICNALTALIVNFFVHKHFNRLKFLLMAIFSPLIVQPLVVAATLAIGDTSINLFWHFVWSYGSAVAAALIFMPLVAIFEGIFNIADDFRLSELCNLSNPLLKRLASEAPGTFNHSLVVGNLAEACASAIGENPNMARCAAYYHDIGKLKAPLYFSENQSSYNPHDELIPEVSVSMITSHTLFGEILAKQNRLPSEIVDICRQHHGTSPVGYFYRKALSLREDGELAVNKYTYAGPKPQTKIAAIIMVADTIEAAMRAYTPDTREDYVARINKLVDEKIELRQFDECPITMGDIAVIKRTIIEVLPSIHHRRVDYDKRKKD